MVTVLKLFFDQNRWFEDKYDDIFIVRFAQANFHICKHPFKEEEEVEVSISPRKKSAQ